MSSCSTSLQPLLISVLPLTGFYCIDIRCLCTDLLVRGRKIMNVQTQGLLRGRAALIASVLTFGGTLKRRRALPATPERRWKPHFDDLRDLPLDGEYRLLRAEEISRGYYLAEYCCPDGMVRHFGLNKQPRLEFWLCTLPCGEREIALTKERYEQFTAE